MDTTQLEQLKFHMAIAKTRQKQLEFALDRLTDMIDDIQEQIYKEQDASYEYYCQSKGV